MRMRRLLDSINKLRKSDVGRKVSLRLNEFKALGRKNNEEWFSELCFCILTANSKARTAISIQQELKSTGFLCHPQDSITECIRRNKHRFHNNKAKYIVEARKYAMIKDIIIKEEDPREWLAVNIKGLGWKEASHFLRNVGYTDYAIIDRHVLNILLENGQIKEKPKSLNKKNYIEIEQKLRKIAHKLEMSQAELDLYLWYMKAGDVLK